MLFPLRHRDASFFWELIQRAETSGASAQRDFSRPSEMQQRDSIGQLPSNSRVIVIVSYPIAIRQQYIAKGSITIRSE